MRVIIAPILKLGDFMAFLTRVGNDKCVGIIRKCGNSAITSAVRATRQPLRLTNAEALSYLRRIAFFRDPYQRLKSGFNHFWTITEMGSGFDDMPRSSLYVEGRGVQADYEAYIDHVLLNRYNDLHWKPQVEVMLSGNTFVPNECYNLADMSAIWPTLFNGRKVGAGDDGNGWQDIPLDDTYRRADIAAAYPHDQVMFDAIAALPAGTPLEGAALDAVVAEARIAFQGIPG